MLNSIEFSCEKVHLDHLSDDNILRFAASDDDSAPDTYLIIDISESPAHQDQSLGHGSYYIEICDQLWGQYGGILSISISENTLTIHFDKESVIGKQILSVKLNFPNFEHDKIINFFKLYFGSLML